MILIDADVLLDFFFDRQPFSEDATKILELCESKSIKAVTTVVIICNVYYLLRKTASHKIVVEKLKQLLLIIDVLPTDKKGLLDALNSSFKDFEDAFQHFSALNYGQVQVIITRNVKDYRHSQLAVFTPTDYLKIL